MAIESGTIRRYWLPTTLVAFGVTAVVVLWRREGTPSRLETLTEGFAVCRSSTSPDRRYLCVVTKKETGEGKGLRHLYRFGMVQVGPDSIGRMPGGGLEIDAGPRALGTLDVRWSARGAEVFASEAGPRPVARCEFRAGRQYWTDARATPTTRPATTSRRAGVGAPGRRAEFNSWLALRVWALEDWQVRRHLGDTPAAGPLAIPEGPLWAIEPLAGASLADVLEQEPVREIPGLVLREATDGDLARLRGWPALEGLWVGGPGVTDAGLVNLAELKGLRVLELEAARVSDAGLAHLGRLTRLQAIGLSDTGVTDAGLAHLEGLGALESLDLSWTRITDAGLARLRGLTQLRTLRLALADVTDAGLAHLGELRSLRVLSLYHTKITDEGLARLGELKAMQDLNLGQTRITDAGLVHLQGLTALWKLDLNMTGITDAGLVHLQGLTALRKLDLSMTGITDAGLVHVRGLTALRQIDLGKTRVTDAGEKGLKRALPHTLILR